MLLTNNMLIQGDEHVKHKNILATSVALAVAGSAWAESDLNTELPEIVITATKRESTVQDTPISVTAISASDIANKGLTDFNSLAQTVPGIAMRTAGPGQTEFEMRGLNSAGGNTSVVGFLLRRDRAVVASLGAAGQGCHRSQSI
jgi:iron complex outermembrane receptor protein